MKNRLLWRNFFLDSLAVIYFKSYFKTGRHKCQEACGGLPLLARRGNYPKISKGEQRKNNSVYLQDVFFLFQNTELSLFSVNLADFLGFIYLWTTQLQLQTEINWNLQKAIFLLQAYFSTFPNILTAWCIFLLIFWILPQAVISIFSYCGFISFKEYSLI